MKTGRRGFLGAVAALAGAAVIAPKAEAAAPVDPWAEHFHNVRVQRDEHGNVFSGNTITGIWTSGHSLDGVLISNNAFLTAATIHGNVVPLKVSNEDDEGVYWSPSEAAALVQRGGDTTLHRAVDRMVADARAEGYADGYTQGYQVAESQAALPLTFERMQADCERRGCELYRSDDGYIRHWFDDPRHMTGEWYAGINAILTPYGWAQVDAWRRSLHESGG